MKKITSAVIQEFVAKNAIELKCTHSKLCVPIIDRIYSKMCKGLKVFEIKVKDDLICDGHHRYLASLLANYEIAKVPSLTTSATDIIRWELVVFEENDWEDVHMIKYFNRQDAIFNNITLQEMEDLLN